MGAMNDIFWEDLEVGYTSQSPGRTMTETDIVSFAGLSGDFNVIHTDVEFCRTTPFSKPIAHGLLGLSMASGLAARMPGYDQHRIVAFLGMTWDFRNPIFAGDTITLKHTVTSKRPTKKPGLGIVIYQAELLKHDGTLCQEGEWKLMYMMRDVHAATTE